MAKALGVTVHSVRKLERRHFLGVDKQFDKDIVKQGDHGISKKNHKGQQARLEALREASTTTNLQLMSYKTLAERCGILNKKHPGACLTVSALSKYFRRNGIRKKVVLKVEKCHSLTLSKQEEWF